MSTEENCILSVENLQVSFRTDEGEFPILRGLSYTLPTGRILAVVGESGSGKTVHALALLRLLPPAAHITGGKVIYQGKDIVHLTKKELRNIRGGKISMIFQDPSASLNPVLTIGEQLTETILAHKKITKQVAQKQAAALLEKVGIRESEKRLQEYPFQFSGGMCQRVMIAMALALKPDVLIADEPTTALDVTIQAQILRLMRDLQKESGMSAIFITHNLAVVAGVADEVLVLYGGLCMEQAEVNELFASPLHPYTQGLLKSLVSVDKKKDRLPAIEGQPPIPSEIGKGCPFAPRCTQALPICFEQCPPLTVKGTHRVRCWLQEGK
jgi:oligopeptide/dipeptide ABC transporter ATP-binding protein